MVSGFIYRLIRRYEKHRTIHNMADGMQIKIEGLKPILNKMKNLSQSKAATALSGAMNKAAKPVISAARKAAPKESNALRKSLGANIRKYKRKMFIFMAVGARKGMSTEYKGRKRSPNRYLHILEGGSRKFSGLHFMRNALANMRSKVISIFKVELAKRVEKALSK